MASVPHSSLENLKTQSSQAVNNIRSEDPDHIESLKDPNFDVLLLRKAHGGRPFHSTFSASSP